MNASHIGQQYGAGARSDTGVSDEQQCKSEAVRVIYDAMSVVLDQRRAGRGLDVLL